MDKQFFSKKRFKKMIVYASAAILFTAAPVLPIYAAENTQPANSAAETPAAQDSQPVSSDTPSETPDSNNINQENVAAQNPQTPEIPTTQLPADVTVTPLPEPSPADQGGVEVTPMQITVYAASSKGLNVRSGPSTNYNKLGTLKYGEEITVTGVTADNWYQIQYSGKVGYVLADYVSNTPLTTTQSPAPENPVSDNPVPENPDPNAGEPLPAETPVNEAETETESISEEGYTETVSSLIGNPIVFVLAATIVGVMALLGFTVYSLFKKESDDEDEYYEDEYYEDEQYSDDAYYEDDYSEDEQYSDDEYYEDEQYSDDEYYEDKQYSDDEYYEGEQYSDDKYYENDEQYSEDEYYEDDRYDDTDEKH